MSEDLIPAVKIENLTKTFPVPFRKEKVVAVDNLSLSVKQGEVYGLIGPNGSGKSTTMKVLLGLISATSGNSSVFGMSSTETASRGSVGFLPENPYFLQISHRSRDHSILWKALWYQSETNKGKN